ncbi:hypothetical protein ABZP36_007763 [Zizania latifolia]
MCRSLPILFPNMGFSAPNLVILQTYIGKSETRKLFFPVFQVYLDAFIFISCMVACSEPLSNHLPTLSVRLLPNNLILVGSISISNSIICFVLKPWSSDCLGLLAYGST